MKDIIILGTGGNSIDIADTIEDINDDKRQYNLIGFFDDNPELVNREVDTYPVLGSLSKESAEKFKSAFFINGIGSPKTYVRKKEIISKLQVPLSRFVNIIHPSSIVSRRAQLGCGIAILQNCTVNVYAKICNHVIMLCNSAVEHHAVVGDYCCICGGVIIAGNVRIEESCYLATGVILRDGIAIGSGTLVGMGSVVVNDIDKNQTVIGVPAKPKSF